MTGTDSVNEPLHPSNDWTVFVPALLMVVVLGVGLIAFPQNSAPDQGCEEIAPGAKRPHEAGL